MDKTISNKPGNEQSNASDTLNSTSKTQAPTPLFPNHDPHISSAALDGPINNGAKVAIPRLHRRGEEKIATKRLSINDKNRVAHACEPCRHRKTKCSGERPECRHCQDFNLTCIYMGGKRDRTRKQLGNLAGKVEGYERLLRDLSLRAGAQDQELIHNALGKDTISDDDDAQTNPSPRGRTKYSRNTPGEEKASARDGSTESMDRVNEDFNRGPESRATGFHGKNSELTWMQRLSLQASTNSSDENDENAETMTDGIESEEQTTHTTPSISASSYHCDDLSVLLNDDIDAYAMPTQGVASILFDVYLKTVHPMFPIIGKNTFTQQFNAYFKHPYGQQPNRNWKAILNMIFAIGAKYSLLIRADWAGTEMDHLVYFTRARLLGFNPDNILGHADLQKVQITGLIAFYLMAINQINRSWAVSGIAIRHASTLGLNLRNESRDVSDSSKEIRYRVWWALCSTERLLSVMTGRPTSFLEADCTAPLPLPLEEDAFLGHGITSPQNLQMLRRWSSEESGRSDLALTPASSESSQKKCSPASSLSPPTTQPAPNNAKQPFPPCSALAFGYLSKLNTFTNEVLNRLYRAAGMNDSWAQVQSTIASLNDRLESWRQRLPPVFDFGSKNHQDRQFVSQRMCLGLLYYSTLTIINRPCLCRVDRKIPDESDKAKAFDRETAIKCVHAARDMLGLLPDEPDARTVYPVAPWWCMVHLLMQAATVSMLELSFRADHAPDEVDEVFHSANKALGWLRNMAEQDEAARRATVLCNDMLRRVAPKVGKTATEVSNGPTNGGLPTNAGLPTMKVENGPQDMDTRQTIEEQQATYPFFQTTQAPQINPMSTTTDYFPQQQYGYLTTAPMQPNVFTSYDQMQPYGQLPTTSAQMPAFDDFYPTAATDMEGMTFPDDLYSQDQDNGGSGEWWGGTSGP